MNNNKDIFINACILVCMGLLFFSFYPAQAYNNYISYDCVIKGINTESFIQSGTPLPRNITQDMTLNINDSPYIANQDVNVQAGVKLTVNSGVEIRFTRNAGLYVRGRVVMNGTADEIITLKSAPGTNSWEVVSLIETTGISTFTYVKITGCTEGDDSDRDIAAISAFKSTVIIDNIDIHDVEVPVYINRGQNNIVKNSTFHSEYSCDYVNFRDATGIIENCDFIGNDASDTDAIDFDASTGTITGNRLSGFTGLNTDGIDVGGATSNVFINNNIFSNIFDKAMSIGERAKAQIERNIIFYCSAGIASKDLAELVVTNNTFYRNDTALSAYMKEDVGWGGGILDVKNCIIYGSSIPIYSKDNSEVSVSYSLCNTQLIPGPGNIVGNPLFVNPFLEDFHLQPGSPAIDSGDPLSPNDSDGTRVDIGAFPYNQLLASKIIINEINYMPLEYDKENQNLEYIELLNVGEANVILSGYIFSHGINYKFKEGSSISPGEYIIVAKNIDYYESLHIKGYEWTSGNLSNNGELIRLEDNNGRFITELAYFSELPWPELPVSGNFSIELDDSEKDYTKPENWRVSYNFGGTPGESNNRELVTDIHINEFVARYGDIYPDEFGNYSDWIEIYNSGDTPTNLGGLFFTDELSNLTAFRLPYTSPDSTTIQPGEFLVLWADGQPEKGILHLDFQLNSGGEQIGIAQDFNNSIIIIDSYEFSSQNEDVSYGRYPDGSHNFEFFEIPTPGSSNLYKEDLIIDSLFLNEIVSKYGTVYPDENGLYSDWIELFNSSENPIDIGGLYLTDNYDDPILSLIPLGIPDSTTIAPGGFMVFHADAKEELGFNHLSFELMSSGEMVGLVQIMWKDTIFIDSVSFNYLGTDISYGRYPDGSDNLEIFNIITPDASNGRLSDFLIEDLFINEIVSRYGTVFPDEHGLFSDWIEIYNNGTETIDIGGLYISDRLDDPYLFMIPTGQPDSTSIEAGEFLILRADAEPKLGVLHVGIQLMSSGESVGLFQRAGNETHTIDTLVFGVLGTDISYGHYPDASNHYTVFDYPSPGASNEKLENQLITGLYINELMARYENSYPDEHGLFSDWIELFNSTNRRINLGGLYLSDDKNNLDMHKISTGKSDSTYIDPGKFFVFRADALPKLGVNHLVFQLVSSGEDIVLSQILWNDTIVIDSLSYPPQALGISYGRIYDGNSEWQFYPLPTPGISNSGISSSLDIITKPDSDMKLFPNPFTNGTNIKFQINNYERIGINIIDMNGRFIRELIPAGSYYYPGSHTILWDGRGNNSEELPQGVYMISLRIENKEVNKRALLLK